MAPPVTVIHVSPLAAVQLQPAAVVTVTDPVPPVLEKFARVGEIEYVHVGGGGGGGGVGRHDLADGAAEADHVQLAALVFAK